MEVRAGNREVLLIGSFPLTSSACLSIQPRTTCPGLAPPIVDWASTVIINHENWHMSLPPDPSNGGHSTVEVPCPQMSKSCVKVTKLTSTGDLYTWLTAVSVAVCVYNSSPCVSKPSRPLCIVMYCCCPSCKDPHSPLNREPRGKDWMEALGRDREKAKPQK